MSSQVSVSFLENIKQQIIEEVTPIATDGQLSSQERFNYNFIIAQTTYSEQAIKDAFDAAKAIEDVNAKAVSLIDLLELISVIQEDNLPIEDSKDGIGTDKDLKN